MDSSVRFHRSQVLSEPASDHQEICTPFCVFIILRSYSILLRTTRKYEHIFSFSLFPGPIRSCFGPSGNMNTFFSFSLFPGPIWSCFRPSGNLNTFFSFSLFTGPIWSCFGPPGNMNTFFSFSLFPGPIRSCFGSFYESDKSEIYDFELNFLRKIIDLAVQQFSHYAMGTSPYQRKTFIILKPLMLF